jgi:hypothetical protein
MSSNYRKSAGRFGEEDDDDFGVNRPPPRPLNNVNVSNSRQEDTEQRPGLDATSVAISDDGSDDPILSRSFCPAAIFGEDDDDMSSLGNDTTANNISMPVLPPNLPYYKPMTDDEWKAIVMAATNPPVSEHNIATTIDARTLESSTFRHEPTTSQQMMIRPHIIENEDVVGPGINKDSENSRDSKSDKSRTKRTSTQIRIENKKTNEAEVKKKKNRKGNSARSERKKLPEQRRGKKKLPEEEGSSSLSNSAANDPSSRSRMDHHGESRKRVAKKSRKTRSSSPREGSSTSISFAGDPSFLPRSRTDHTNIAHSRKQVSRKSRKTARSPSPRRRRDGTHHRRRSQSCASKSISSSRKEGERKSRSKSRKKRTSTTGQRRSPSSVDPREIIEFLSKPSMHTDIDEMSLHPERDEATIPAVERRDAVRLSPKDHGRDRSTDGGKGSLEFIIASTPKPRPPNWADLVNRSKGQQPRGVQLVQKMWGTVSGGIRGRGDTNINRAEI